MSLRPWKLLTLSLGVGSMWAGCAHQQAARTASAEPTPAPTPTPAPVAQAAPAQPSSESIDAILSGAVAHFEFDRDQLTADGQDKLQKVAEAMKAHPAAHVRISGHCDELGTEEYNLALGQRRAEVAKRYLVALGVDASHVDTISYGEERPADPGHNEKAWAANRRDELEPEKL